MQLSFRKRIRFTNLHNISLMCVIFQRRFLLSGSAIIYGQLVLPRMNQSCLALSFWIGPSDPRFLAQEVRPTSKSCRTLIFRFSTCGSEHLPGSLASRTRLSMTQTKLLPCGNMNVVILSVQLKDIKSTSSCTRS